MKGVGAALFVLAFIVGAFLFAGLIWMLSLGALAHIFNAPNLAIGYWPSVLVAFIASVLLSGVGAFNRRK